MKVTLYYKGLAALLSLFVLLVMSPIYVRADEVDIKPCYECTNCVIDEVTLEPVPPEGQIAEWKQCSDLPSINLCSNGLTVVGVINFVIDESAEVTFLGATSLRSSAEDVDHDGDEDDPKPIIDRAVAFNPAALRNMLPHSIAAPRHYSLALVLGAALAIAFLPSDALFGAEAHNVPTKGIRIVDGVRTPRPDDRGYNIDIDLKREAFDIIMKQYTDESFDYEDALLNSAIIIRVEIQSMTGKQSDI